MAAVWRSLPPSIQRMFTPWIAGGASTAILEGKGRDFGDVDVYVVPTDDYESIDIYEELRCAGWVMIDPPENVEYPAFFICTNPKFQNLQLIFPVQDELPLDMFDLEVCKSAFTFDQVIEPDRYVVALAMNPRKIRLPFKTIWRAAKYCARGYETDHSEIMMFLAYALKRRYKRSIKEKHLNLKFLAETAENKGDVQAYVAIRLLQSRLTLATMSVIMSIYGKRETLIVLDWLNGRIPDATRYP